MWSRRFTGTLISFVLLFGALALASWRLEVTEGRGWAGFIAFPQREASKPPVRDLPFGWHLGGVYMVLPFGPAERAGVAVGDDVVSVNGVSIFNRAGLEELDRRFRRGDVVVFRLRHDGVVRDVPIRFESPLRARFFLPMLAVSAIVAAIFFAIGLFIFWRGPDDRRATVFLAMTVIASMQFISSAAYAIENGAARGVALEAALGMIPQAVVYFVTFLLFLPLLLHLALLFPKPRPVVVDRPEILRWIYGPPAVIFVAMVAMIGAEVGDIKHKAWLPRTLLVLAAAAILVAVVRMALRMRHEGTAALSRMPLTTQIAVIGLFATSTAVAQRSTHSVTMIVVIGAICGGGVIVGFLAYPIAAVVALYRTYRESGLEEKRQVKWPLWAIAVSLVLRLSCAAFGGYLEFSRMTGRTVAVSAATQAIELVPRLFYILIPISFAFAIVKYRLMNIDLIIRRTVTYAILSVVVFVVYGVLLAGFGALLVHLFGVTNQAVLVASTIVVALMAVPLRNRLQLLVDHNVFRERVSYPLALRTLAEAVSGGATREELLRLLAEQLQQALQNRVVLVAMRSDQHFVAAAKVGIADEILGTFRVPVFEITRPLDPERGPLPLPLSQRLRRLGAHLVVPIRAQRDAIGFVALGAKLSNDPFSAEDIEFLAAATSQVAMALETSRLRSEEVDFEQARAMQQILLPKSLPHLDGFDIAGMWQPARSVGGDYYDALLLGDGKAAVCIADVAGKGMPAALLMASLQAAVKATASADTPPRRLCEKVRHVVAGNLTGGTFITFFYAMLDTSERTLTYCNAGHNPPLLVRATGEVERLDTGGSVLGRLFRGESYDQATVPLDPGDRVVLFTDGVSEARRGGEDFGDERLIDVVQSNRELSAAELQEKIVEAITSFTSGAFGDDVTMVVIGAK